ncbi:MAG: hypothetical protein WBV11_04810 [Salegentibacter sp.]
MKTLQLVFVGLALCATSLCRAVNAPDFTFTQEVYKYLNNLPVEVKEEVKVNVVFTMNEHNEIEIKSVETEDPYLRKVITRRLEHRKMYSFLDPSIKEYTLPIVIKL